MNRKGKMFMIHWFNTLMFTSEKSSYLTYKKNMTILNIFSGKMDKAFGNKLLLLIQNIVTLENVWNSFNFKQQK